jgi:hypothetical protein
MELRITAGQAGKKRPLIENRIIEIADIGSLPTVRLFISAVVAHQVREYNNQPREKSLIPFWTPSGMEEQLDGGGKVGFGSLYNEHKADLERAQQTALEAFEDTLEARWPTGQQRGICRYYRRIPSTGEGYSCRLSMMIPNRLK